MQEIDASAEYAIRLADLEDADLSKVTVIILSSDVLFGAPETDELDAAVLNAVITDASVHPVPKRSVKMLEAHDPVPLASVPEPAHEAPVTTAQVAVPGVSDIAQLSGAIPKMQNEGAAVVMAGIAVLGGGAAWKFYSQKNKLAHEERLEKMKLDHERSQHDHGQCQMVQATLQAKLAELEAKLGQVEQKSLSLSKGFDPEEIEDRLEALEKKAPRRKKAGEGS